MIRSAEDCRWPCCAIHPTQHANGAWITIWDHDCDGPPPDKRYPGWERDLRPKTGAAA